jgi:NADH-quinone oxidoreductase subunit E
MSGHPCGDTMPLAAILERYPAAEPSLIQVLQDVHRAYNYLPCDVLEKVAEALDVPLARVFSVATFYRAFSLDPQGRTLVRVCTGTACHIRGDPVARGAGAGGVRRRPPRSRPVKTVNCVGACAMAPVLISARVPRQR